MKMRWETTGEGMPLVLVPGGLTGWLSWLPHAQRLSSTRRVIRVQLLNVQLGMEAQPLPEDYSVKTESAALAAMLDDLGLTAPVDIAAWSFGAMVTLDFALDHPERMRSLTLIEPPAFWVLPALDAEAQRHVAALQRMMGDISEEQLEEFSHIAAIVPPGQSAWEMPQWPLWVQHRQSLRNSPNIVAYHDDPARLRSFQPPVLLVKGTGSTPYLHQIIDELASRLPHAEVAEWPAGHVPHIISMEPFLNRMAEFHQAAAGVA
jgi:pimeloyl-ACP methyl ester carboxylesterase